MHGSIHYFAKRKRAENRELEEPERYTGPSLSRVPIKCSGRYCGHWITERGRKEGFCDVCKTPTLRK